jgi:hypothetical protein
LPSLVYIADLQKQHNLVIQQLRNHLDNTEAELNIANERRENAENLLEVNRQNIQQTQDIRRNAEQLLQEAKTTQETVNAQLEIARKIRQEAEDVHENANANANSGNFGWRMGWGRYTVGVLAASCIPFSILFLGERLKAFTGNKE